MEIVEEIVSKTILLTDRLKLAIIHQDNLAKKGFHVNGKELSNNLEAHEKAYVSTKVEFERLEDKVKKEECKLSEIYDELKKIFEENRALKKTENALINLIKPTPDERLIIANELSNKLKIYKLLTGVRFDYKHAENTLSGYVAISEKEPYKSTCIPFEIESNNSICNEILWEKINEACLDVITDT